MRTLNISLPDAMTEFVEEQLTAHDYASVSEYFRDLVRGDQKRLAKEQLEQVLLAALDSEDPTELTAELIDETRQRLHNRTR